MINFHENIRARFPVSANTFTLRDLMHWANLFLEQTNRGLPFKKSLFAAAKQAYQRASSDIVSENLATHFPSNVLRQLRAEIRPHIPEFPTTFNDSSEAVTFGRHLRTYFKYLSGHVARATPEEGQRKLLFFAAEHIIALSSVSTAEFRIRWFNHAQEIGLTAGNLSEIVAKTIGVLASHPVVREAKARVTRAVGDSLELDEHPFDLLTNEPLVYEIQRKLVNSDAEEEWKAIEGSFDRLPALVSKLLGGHVEKAAYQPPAGKSVKSYSVLQQSYTFQQKKINAQSLRSPKLTPLVLPFFEYLDEFLEDLLTNLSYFVDFELLKPIQHVISLRNKLWHHVQSAVDIDLAKFSLYVTWIGKQVTKLVAAQNKVAQNLKNPGQLVAVPSTFSAVYSAIADQIREEFGAEFKAVLWKFAKSLPLRDARIREAYNNLAEFSYPEVKVEEYSDKLLLEEELDRTAETRPTAVLKKAEEKYSEHLSPKHKRMLLEGMTTLQWLDLNATPEAEPEMNAENAETPKSSELEDQDEECKQKLVETLVALPSSISESHLTSTDPFKSSLSLTPLLDLLSTHQSLVQELFAVLRVGFVLGEKGNENSAANVEMEVEEEQEAAQEATNNSERELKQLLKSFVDFGIDQTSRKVLDFSGYHRLLWMLDSSTSEENTKISGSELRNIFAELLFSFQHRLWNNSLNSFTPFLETTADKLSQHEFVQRANMFKKLSGTSKLFQSFHTSVVSFTMYDSQHSLSIKEREANVETVKKLVTYLERRPDFPHAQKRIETPEEGDWKLYCLVLEQTILAFVPYFDNSKISELLAFFTSVRSLNASKDHSNVLKTSEIALEILGDCRDSKFTEFSKKFLVPSISLIREVSRTNREASNEVRGRLWILLGLFRVFLYLPSQPVDPAQKYSEKSEHIKSEIAEIDAEIEVCKEAEAFFTGNGTNAKITKLERRKESLIEKYVFSLFFIFTLFTGTDK